MIRTFRRISSCLPAVAVTLGLLGLLAPVAQATITIGIAGPLSGPVAQYGDMQFAGARLAIAHINAEGGVNGQPLEAVEVDDACDPRQAIEAARQLIERDVRFVVGHLCSSSTQPASDLYEANGVLMITPASTNPDITRRGYERVFRTIGLDSMQGAVAAHHLAALGKARVGIVHDSQQYGEGIARQVRTTLEELGVSVPVYEGIVSGERNFAAVISRLKQANVDAIYYGGYHPELGLILRQARAAELNAPFMGPEGVGNRDLNSIAGDAADGLLVTLPPEFSRNPENRSLVAALEQQDIDASGPFVLTAYTAVQLIAEGIRRAGSDDPDQVARALRHGEFDTPIGRLSFQDNGDLTHFDFMVYRWHADGTRTALSGPSGANQ